MKKFLLATLVCAAALIPVISQAQSWPRPRYDNVQLNNDPSLTTDAARKGYVDTQTSTRLPLGGGTLTGPLTVPALTSTGAVTVPALTATGTLTAAKIAGTFHLTGSTTAAHFGLTTTALGSGTNGPTTAQDGMFLNISKDNWFNYPPASAVGEVDGLNIIGRQGTGAGCTSGTQSLCSDMSGILVDVQNTGLGFVSMTEMASNVVDNNPASGTFNTLLFGIDIQEGGLDEVTGQYIGELINGIHGTLTAAIQIQATGSGASWTNAIVVTSPGIGTVYKVSGTGDQTVYGHQISTGPTPTLTGGTFVATASDVSGTIAETAAGTGWTLTFNAAWGTQPDCVVVSSHNDTFTYTVSNTAITATNSALTGAKFVYHCTQ